MTRNTSTARTENATARRIRVWFGEHVVSDYRADPERAQRYAELTRQRFAGLCVTVDDPPPNEPGDSLPDELLWPLTVK